MKSLISVAAVVIFLFQFVFVDADLIDDTCLKTPKPDLCFSSLRSFYKTHEPADVRELAIIMASTVLVDKVYATDNTINELLKESPAGYRPLLDCANNFGQIKNNNIRQFRRSLVNKDYGNAVQEIYGVLSLADGCRSGIGLSRSPLVNMCAEVSDLANDAASIVMELIKIP